MMNDELKPCPFCGGEAEITMHHYVEFTLYRIECKKKCDV